MTTMDYQFFILLAPTLALVLYAIINHQNTKGGIYEPRSRRDHGRDGMRDYPTLHFGWGGRHNITCKQEKNGRPTIRT